VLEADARLWNQLWYWGLEYQRMVSN
jgi:hypothetical protein